MKKFNEWLTEKDPNFLEEGFGKNLLTAALIGAAGYGAGAVHNARSVNTASVQDNEWDNDDDTTSRMNKHHRDLLAAAKRAGVPKSEWNKLRGEKRGGVVVSVNGRKVKLTKAEQEEVNFADQLRARMGN
jgi:hypothetical protein